MSEELDMIWAKLSEELNALKQENADLRVKTEKAGQAFSFPISTLAQAPLAADGMNTYAVRFITDWNAPAWYNPSLNYWTPFGQVEIVKYTILSGSAATIDIQNIPAGFHMLVLVPELRTNAGGVSTDQFIMRFNNDAGNNYYYVVRRTAHSAVTVTIEGIAVAGINNFTLGATAPANYRSTHEIKIPGYAQTGRPRRVIHTGMRQFGNTTGDIEEITGGGTWTNTVDAINRITLLPSVGSNFVAGSAYVLYGIGRAA